MQQVPLIPCPVRENLFQSQGYFYTKPFLITDEVFGGSDSVRRHPTSFSMGLRGKNASIMLSTCSYKIQLICISFVRVCWVCEGLMSQLQARFSTLFCTSFQASFALQVSDIHQGWFSDLEMPIPTSYWCCKSSKGLEELCPLRLLAAQKSESRFCDDIWSLAIWSLKGSGIMFCKNSGESCYSFQGLREIFGTDTRNTLLGDLFKYHVKTEQIMGKTGLTH